MPRSKKGWKKVNVRAASNCSPVTTGSATLAGRVRADSIPARQRKSPDARLQTGPGRADSANSLYRQAPEAQPIGQCGRWNVQRQGMRRRPRNGLTNLCKTEREMGKEWECPKPESDTRVNESPEMRKRANAPRQGLAVSTGQDADSTPHRLHGAKMSDGTVRSVLPTVFRMRIRRKADNSAPQIRIAC